MKSNPKEFMAIEQSLLSKICSLIYFKAIKDDNKAKGNILQLDDLITLVKKSSKAILIKCL